MQEYVKDFANRIGGRNRGKWRHEDKKEKRSSGAVSDGSWQDCAWRDSWDLRQGCVRKSGRYSGLGSYRKKGLCIRLHPVGQRRHMRQQRCQKSRTIQSFPLHAQSAVLMDGLTGRILYGKNENDIRPMASTTKIMTCILALEAGGLDEFAEASSNAAAQPQVRLGVKRGALSDQRSPLCSDAGIL